MDGFREIWTEHGGFGDDTQSALSADEQLLQVIARVVLPQRAIHIQNLAIRQDDLQAQDRPMYSTFQNDCSVSGILRENVGTELRKIQIAKTL